MIDGCFGDCFGIEKERFSRSQDIGRWLILKLVIGFIMTKYRSRTQTDSLPIWQLSPFFARVSLTIRQRGRSTVLLTTPKTVVF